MVIFEQRRGRSIPLLRRPPDRLTEIRRYRGRAGSSFPFLPRRSAHIPSRTLMHGSPWLRASEATRIRRRQINGLMVVMGAALAIELWRAAGLIQASPERLGGIAVLIGVALLNGLGRPSYASIGANNELRMHDYPLYPIEVLNRAADVFRMAGHM